MALHPQSTTGRGGLSVDSALLGLALVGPPLAQVDLKLVGLVLLLLLWIIKSPQSEVPPYLGYAVGASAGVLFYGLLLELVGVTRDSTIIFLALQSILVLIAAHAAAELYSMRYGIHGTSRLVKHVVAWIAVNAVLGLASLVSASVRSAFYNYLSYERSEYLHEFGFRSLDPGFGGGAQAAMTFAMIFGVALTLPPSRARFIAIPVLAVSAAAAGTSGIVLALVLFVTYRTLRVLEGRPVGHAQNRSQIRRLLLTTAVSILLTVTIWQGANPEFISWISRGALEADAAEVIPGIRGDEEVDVWQEMFRELPSMDHLLLGTGTYGRKEGAVLASDIGYVRVLHGGGLIGVFLVYGPIFFLAGKLVRSFRRSHTPQVNGQLAGAVIVTLGILVASLKEFHIVHRASWFAVGIVVMCAWRLYCSHSRRGWDERPIRSSVRTTADPRARA